jgi:hypothetical protein
MALTRVQRAHYIMEAHELAGTLLARLAELESGSTNWQNAVDAADKELDQGTPDVDSLATTLRSQVAIQTSFFDLLEAFLAAWARLSLLCFPNKGASTTAEFRLARGEALRLALAVPTDSPLADRDLRNAWMHFDERLDEATVSGSIGDRHRFVRSAEIGPHLDTTLRLLELDTLVVHYRTQTETAGVFDLRNVRSELERLYADSADPMKFD